MKRLSLAVPLLLGAMLVAFPAGAQKEAAAPDLTVEAGMTPDNPLSFFDRAFDALHLFFAGSQENKVEVALEISQERAAEALAMGVAGNPDAMEKAVDGMGSSLDAAAEALEKIEEPEQAKAAADHLGLVAEANAQALNQAAANAPEEHKEEVAQIVDGAGPALAAAQAAAQNAPAGEGCNQDRFEACVTQRNCTENTSQTCFLACPSVAVPCDGPAPGKTCRAPNTACVSQCLQTLVGCADICRAQAGCSQDDPLDDQNIRYLNPDRIRAAFSLESADQVQ